MSSRMDPRVDNSTIHRLPQAFINKKGDAILIRTLDDKICEDLIKMYLGYQPRGSFHGLPPLKDEACVKWVQHMIGNGINLVALSFQAGVVGHITLVPIDDQTCEMLVVVAPDFQNTGIGTQLTRCAVQLAYEIGFNRIWLSVERRNVRARHVYKKCGFECFAKGDSREMEMALDLKRYHDAVSILVEKIMNPHVITISADEPCKRAIELFVQKRIASLPVIDADRKLIGIITESDLMLPSNLDKYVRDIYSQDVLMVRFDSPLSKVVRMFQFKKIRSIPVVDETGKLVGIVGRKDVLTYYANRL